MSARLRRLCRQSYVDQQKINAAQVRTETRGSRINLENIDLGKLAMEYDPAVNEDEVAD